MVSTGLVPIVGEQDFFWIQALDDPALIPGQSAQGGQHVLMSLPQRFPVPDSFTEQQFPWRIFEISKTERGFGFSGQVEVFMLAGLEVECGFQFQIILGPDRSEYHRLQQAFTIPYRKNQAGGIFQLWIVYAELVQPKLSMSFHKRIQVQNPGRMKTRFQVLQTDPLQ